MLYYDSKITMHYCPRIKYIDVWYHKIREWISLGDLSRSKIHINGIDYNMSIQPVHKDKFYDYLDFNSICSS